ncbi:unnamed protein product [Thelazia callipaeda]|uniref:HTH psq-type domain-containing protein n=1 Tax=Thelazia callipaeda TaxID=103827 RepID=A0A0N5D387_THECL|nr:unnamed protein product [Thelazia callipaeda]
MKEREREKNESFGWERRKSLNFYVSTFIAETIRKVAGFEQVSTRYSSRNSECQSIVDIISTAFTAGILLLYFTEHDCNTTAQDWSPSEKCPFCDGLRVSTFDSLEEDSIRMETENESTVNGIDHDCSSQARIEQDRTNGFVENTTHLESSSVPQSCLPYIHPFPNLYTPTVFPIVTPFVPIPEIANQLYCQSLLHWSASGLLLQQINSQHLAENLRSPVNEQYHQALKANSLKHGKENSESETNHFLRPLVSDTSNEGKRVAHVTSKNDLSNIYLGIEKSSSFMNCESLSERLTFKEENSDNGTMQDDQPLDLSSRCALQVANQCVMSSSIQNYQDDKRSLPAITNNSSNTLSIDEETDSMADNARNAVEVTMINSTISKRSYSQADLDAAVRDIRYGRLGTRRASVVYGIPRSTLRNKIYKLEAAEDQHADGTCRKKKRVNSISPGITLTPNNLRIFPITAVSPSNNINDDPTEITIPSRKELILMDNTSMSNFVHEIGSSNRPHYTKQEPIIVNDQQTMENKKSLWSPFAIQSISDPKSIQHEDKKVIGSPVHSTGSQSDWKRSRPKRGQYRKYKKDALDEAVRSVRRGEMSVHRAGSFYGVPHSTLEYKVKERNLMRTKHKKATAGNAFEAKNSGKGMQYFHLII